METTELVQDALEVKLRQRLAKLPSEEIPTSQSEVPDGFEERLRQRGAAQQPGEPLSMKFPERYFNSHQVIPNTLLAAVMISFLLGGVFFWALGLVLSGSDARWWWTTSQLGIFVAAWAAFHFAEFATTAGWNRAVCTIDSFLLENGISYHLANLTALTEYLTTLYLKPSWKAWPYLSEFGLVLVIGGQALRSLAMITAATNFNHTVQFKKANSHRLVTEGIYSWFRHPSYAGFYYWAIGTQLVLQNPLSSIVFAILLWRFFYYRTRAEEHALIRFFGNEYREYRQRVSTKIPFVP